MKIWEAISTVLNNSRDPLRPKEIYQQIVNKNLYIFKAQDPIHVVINQLRRRCVNLSFPSAYKDKKYVRLSDGRYALSSYNVTNDAFSSPLIIEENTLIKLEHSLDHAYTLYCDSFKELLLEELRNLTPEQFEIFSKNFIKGFGFSNTRVTRRGKDGGIDGFGTLNIGISKLSVAFQCKRWKNKSVGIKNVNEFLGSISGMQKDGTFFDQGFFFTTSEFTADAKNVAKRKGAVPLVLVDGINLVEFMLKNNIGVTTRPLLKYTVSLDDMIDEEVGAA